MIARFRPTYTYSDIILSLFSDKQKEGAKLKKYLEELFSTKHIFLFSQGRAALYVLLQALGTSGEVISPAYNCIVVPDAVRFAGFENRFADVSLLDFNMNYKTVEKALTPKSKVLLATHQFGIPCDVEVLMKLADKNKLFLIEDAAAALGARIGNKLVGTFAKASFFSFQDTKVISGIEGGCLVLHDDLLADKVKSVIIDRYQERELGYIKKAIMYKTSTLPFFYSYIFPLWTKMAGAYTLAEKSEKERPPHYVLKMNKFCMSLIEKQLCSLEKNIEERNSIAQRFIAGLKSGTEIVLPKVPQGVIPAWSRFPVRIKNKKKEEFFKRAISQGIDLAWTFSYSCSKEYNVMTPTPNAEEAARTVLDLPIYPGLSFGEISKIIEDLNHI